MNKFFSFVSVPLSLTICVFLFAPLKTHAQIENVRHRVAILYFENNTAQTCFSPLSKGLCDMMISDFSAEQQFAVVERTRLQEIIKELELEKTRNFDPATSAKIGKLLGAEFLVLGSFFEFMGTFRIDARIVKVETGEVIASVGTAGKADTFEALEKKIVSDLHGQMNVSRKTMRNGNKHPVSLSMAAQYGNALDKIDSGDKPGARALLKDIVEASPDFALAKNMLKKISQ